MSKYEKEFAGTTFGSTDYDTLIFEALFQVASGFCTGTTMRNILLRLGYREEHHNRLTDAGRREMYNLREAKRSGFVKEQRVDNDKVESMRWTAVRFGQKLEKAQRTLEFYASGKTDSEIHPDKKEIWDDPDRWKERSMSHHWTGKLARETLKELESVVEESRVAQIEAFLSIGKNYQAEELGFLRENVRLSKCLAVATAALEDMKDKGLRADLNPTQPMFDWEAVSRFFLGYLKSIDQSLRDRAGDALNIMKQV